LILLGVVVAVEDRYGVRITRDQLSRACASGTSLKHLANMIEELPQKQITPQRST
jgi:acyl carrier protein